MMPVGGYAVNKTLIVIGASVALAIASFTHSAQAQPKYTYKALDFAMTGAKCPARVTRFLALAKAAHQAPGEHEHHQQYGHGLELLLETGPDQLVAKHRQHGSGRAQTRGPATSVSTATYVEPQGFL